MNHFLLSALSLSIFSAITALSIWFYKPKNHAVLLFGLYWFSIAFWSFFVGYQGTLLGWFSPFLWGWFLHLGCTFVPVLWLHSAIALAEPLDGRSGVILKWSYFVTVVFNLLNAFTPYFTQGTTYTDAYAYPKPWLFYPLYFIFFIAVVFYGTCIFWKKLSTLPTSLRRGLQLFFLTHIFAYVGAIDNFLIMVELRIPPFYPYGLYPATLYAITAVIAVRRYSLLRLTT